MVGNRSIRSAWAKMLIHCVYDYSKATLATILLFTLLRVLEIIILLNAHTNNYSIWLGISAMRYDLLYGLQLSAIFFLLFFLIHLARPKLARLVHYFLILVISIFNLFLIQFFVKNGKLAGVEIFHFGLANVELQFKTLILSSHAMIAYGIVVLILSLILFPLFYRLRISDTIAAFIMAIMIFSIVFFAKINPQPKNFNSKDTYYLMVNKNHFLTFDAINNLFDKHAEK